MKLFAKWLMLAAFVALAASCSTPAKISYLRDLEYETPYLAKPAPELRLQVEDQVNIQVFSTEARLAAPFNLGGGVTDGIGSALSSTSYTVDKLGNIDFPVLGTIHVEGKTLNELKNDISNEIIRLGYIREPIVKVEMENFNITVIGEGANTIMPVQGNSINILQVVAKLGGLTESAKIPDVMVIRTEEGERMSFPGTFVARAIPRVLFAAERHRVRQAARSAPFLGYVRHYVRFYASHHARIHPFYSDPPAHSFVIALCLRTLNIPATNKSTWLICSSIC